MSNAFHIDTAISAVSSKPGAPRAAVAEIAANDEADYLRCEFVEDKWPAWKTTSFILFTCGAFWTAAIFVASRLIG